MVTAPWDRRRPQEQARVADLVLSRWLPLAVEASPLWHRRMETDGLDPAECASPEGLERLRPARAHHLRADAPGGAGAVMRPTEAQVKQRAPGTLLGRLVAAVRRDGGEGQRTVLLREYQPLRLQQADVDGGLLVASSRSDLDRANLVGARAAAVLGLHDRDLLLDAVPVGPTAASLGVAHLAQGASITALSPRGHGADLEDVARSAALVPATVLAVPVEDARELVRALAAARVPLPRLRRVVTVGPPPDEDLRAAIAAELAPLEASVDVRAAWAPDVGRGLMAECAEGAFGLHSYPDLERLEVVDPHDGQPASGDGDLTVTSMGWHGTVLLRYRTGAWVDAPRTEPCPGCQRTVPRLAGEILPDAWRETLADGRGGTLDADLRGVGETCHARGIGAWRAELQPDPRGGDRLRVEIAGRLADDERERLRDALAEASGAPVELVTAGDEAALSARIARDGGVLVDRR